MRCGTAFGRTNRHSCARPAHAPQLRESSPVTSTAVSASTDAAAKSDHGLNVLLFSLSGRERLRRGTESESFEEGEFDLAGVVGAAGAGQQEGLAADGVAADGAGRSPAIRGGACTSINVTPRDFLAAPPGRE